MKKEKLSNRTVCLIAGWIMLLIVLPHKLRAQTTISVGDISLVGWNSSTSPDGFAFVTWLDLSSGTVIKFTNNAFLSSSSANLLNNARVQQQIIYWTASSAVPAGTVIKIDASASPTASSGTVSYSSQSQGVSLALSNTGGRIFIYQGASDYASAPTSTGTFLGNILYGLNYQGASGSAVWLSSGSAGSTKSYLPSELNNASNNLSFGSNANSGQYTGPRSGQTLANFKSSVQNPANWTTTTGTGTTTFDLTPFTISTVPLTWKSFTGSRVGNYVQLVWQTASEQNTADFTIQRSGNGSSWTDIGTVAAAGNSNTVRQYQFFDQALLHGTQFYRILQRDLDGRISYSDIRRVEFDSPKSPFTLVSNLVLKSELRVVLNKPLMLSLYNSSGLLVWKKQFGAGIQSLDLRNCASGIYYLQAEGQTEKIVLQ